MFGVFLALLLLPGCILTNALGVHPDFSVRGDEVRKVVANLTMLGLTLSLKEYCLDATDSGLCRNSLGPAHDAGVVLASGLTTAWSGIRDHKFYTEESVRFCKEQVFATMLIVPFRYLQYRERESVGGASVLENPREEAFFAAIFAAFLAGEACDRALEEPGPLFYTPGPRGGGSDDDTDEQDESAAVPGLKR